VATRAEERERLRDLRVEREARVREGERRRLLLAGAGGLVVACVVGVVIAIGQSGTGKSGEVAGAAEVSAHLDGLPQSGAFLGNPRAEVTVVEFGDLQCPVCKEYSSSVVSQLIDGPVRDSLARLEFRHLVVLGPESRDAAAAALAAAEQNRQWSFTELFYRNQGFENSGYVDDEFLRGVAEAARVPDLERWEEDRDDPRWDAVLSDVDREARELGFSGTPSFAVSGPGGSTPLGTPGSAGPILGAIRQAG
jgi:protein-disulfide isomerase